MKIQTTQHHEANIIGRSVKVVCLQKNTNKGDIFGLRLTQFKGRKVVARSLSAAALVKWANENGYIVR